MPSPIVKSVRELPLFMGRSEWDSVGLVRRAISDLENGILMAAAQVVDSMGRDDRISGCLLTRTEALCGLPLQLEAGEGRMAARALTRCKEDFPKMFPNAALVDLQRWGTMLGIGPAELDWSFSEDNWMPRLHVWHPQNFYYRWAERRFWVLAEEQEVPITPGDGQWLVYSPHGLERGWMGGKVRSLFIPWLLRQWGMRDWARHSEVLGQTIKKAKVPAGSQDDDKERFIKELARLGNENIIRLPQNADGTGFDLELLEASSGGYVSFKELIATADMCVTIALLGQNLTTEVSGGSYAAAQVHADIKQGILKSDSENLGLCLREQALKPWALYNFGDAEAAPHVSWRTEPPEDKAQTGIALENMGTGISALRSSGAHPDVDKLLTDAGIPFTEKADDNLPPPPAPELPGAGAPPPAPENPGVAPFGKAAKVATADAQPSLDALAKVVPSVAKAKLMKLARDAGWKFRFVKSGGNSCPECDDLDGEEYDADDPFWDENTPPIHPNCECELDPVDPDEED